VSGFRFARLGRHGAVYGVGALLGKAVAFFMLPIYTRYMTPFDFGVLALIDMALEVIAIVAGARLAAGVFHLYHRATAEAERRAVLASAFAVVGGAFVAAGGLTVAAAPLVSRAVFGTPDQAELVRIAATSLALQSLTIVPMAALQLAERSGAFVAANVAKLLIQVVLNIVFLIGFRLGAKGVLLSTLAANAVTGLWLCGGLVRQAGIRPSRAAARDIIRLGLPFIGTQLAKFVQTYGDRWFLRVALGTTTVGVYGLGYQFGFLLATIGYSPFNNVWEPMRFEIAKRPDRDVLYTRAFLYLNLLLVTMAVGLALFVAEFLRVMATPPYYGAAAVVPLVLVAYLAQSWTGFLNVGLFIAERTELITTATWAGALVSLGGNALLIPRLGAMGAALVAAVSFLTMAFMTHRASQRLWPVAYRWTPVVRLLAVATAVVLLAQFVPHWPLPVALAAKAGLLAAYAGGVWAGGILTDADRRFVRQALHSPRAAFAELRS